MKIKLLIFLIGISLSIKAQHLFEIKDKPIGQDSTTLMSYQGKKILIIVLPAVNVSDSIASEVRQFCDKYEDSVQVIGVFSNEDGYSNDLDSNLLKSYEDIPILLLQGQNTGSGQIKESSLIDWLTEFDRNRYSDNKIRGWGQKYFINEVGRLHAILPAEISLQSPFTQHIMGLDNKDLQKVHSQ